LEFKILEFDIIGIKLEIKFGMNTRAEKIKYGKAIRVTLTIVTGVA
jgi:hypothetical protein